MRRLRVAGALAAVGLLGVATAPPVLAVDAAAAKYNFYADSGDACPYGFTEGVLWWDDAPIGDVVTVKGVVVDRPTPEDPKACEPDPRRSVAIFTAYANLSGTDHVVDEEQVETDNATVQFTVTLDAPAPSRWPFISSVSVQVCRVGKPSGIREYCGPVQVYPGKGTTAR